MNTPLPPPPTFNHEFVAPSGAADRPAVALFTPVGAAAGCPIQSSDGDGPKAIKPSVGPAGGTMLEMAASPSDAAARIDVLQTVGATASARCTRFVLDEPRFIAALMSELELMPLFIREPSPEFLRATERGRA